MTLLRVKIITIQKELDRYETAGRVKPIAEDHLLYLLIEDLKSYPLGGELPREGRRLWQALRSASGTRSRKAIALAHAFHDWLTVTYLDTPRLVIDLDAETLMIDGAVYAGIDPTGLRIIKALWDAKQQSRNGENVFVTDERIQKMVPGCKGDHTIPRHLKRLCTPIRNLIDFSSGRGRFLRLPPSPQ